MGELVELCALDPELYCRTFFPRTFRQKTPLFHRDIFDLLEDRVNRYVAIKVFRGGAKTTILRAYASKRIAYGVSRTIMIVGQGSSHAEATLRWLKGQVEHNRLWTEVYGLEPGDKWAEGFITIKHRLLDQTTTVVAMGITGQVRGINIDDFRPDLIIVDDPCDEENTATEDQRKKISDLFFGAIQKSLTPRSEAPDAKMALLQTPLNAEDLIENCTRFPEWATRVYGCFDDTGRSRWEERFPTQELIQEKQEHISRNQAILWLREMECSIVGQEAAVFRQDWLQYWDTLPEPMITFLGIDPVPPPTPHQIATGLRDKDYECLAVVGLAGGNTYLCEISRNKGHTPEWTKAEFFRLVRKWKVLRARVEGITYQRTLKWLLDDAMSRERIWVQINAVDDKRKKSHRIAQAMSGIATHKRLFVHRSHLDFISQFAAYPNVTHDDDLDSVAMALDEANTYGGGTADLYLSDQEDIPDLPQWRAAP